MPRALCQIQNRLDFPEAGLDCLASAGALPFIGARVVIAVRGGAHSRGCRLNGMRNTRAHNSRLRPTLTTWLGRLALQEFSPRAARVKSERSATA